MPWLSQLSHQVILPIGHWAETQFLNVKCSQKNNIWKLSRNVFDEYSAFTDKVSLYDINEIYRMGNEAFELFYKSYIDLSKFDSNHIDIMVNNLGVIKQF